MSKRRFSVPGHRLSVGMMAVALAVMFVGLEARGASANQLEACPIAPEGTAGQKQAGSVNTTTGGEPKIVIINEQGQQVPVGDGQFCVANANGTGEASAGFAVEAAPGAPTNGTTCTIPLPEGAAPGTVLVVTVQGAANSGTSATSCAVSTLSPATTGDPNAAAGSSSAPVTSEVCAVSPFTPANQGPQNAPSDAKPGGQAAPTGTAEAGASAGVQTTPIEGDAQQKGCNVIVLNPALGSGTGGMTSGSGAASSEGAPVCIVSADGGATAGSAAGGANAQQAPDGAVVNGQVVVCPDGEPGTVKPIEPTTNGAASAETGGSFTCVVQDSQNPNTLICTKQP